MTVGEFRESIGVTAYSYRAFMKKLGESAGKENKTYEPAHAFFRKRELQGLPTPQKAKKARAPSAPSKAVDDPKYDVSDIHLDGEEEGEVEIYETCDSIRLMILRHLNKTGITQASFLRQIGKQFGTEFKNTQTSQLQTFLNYDGASHGSRSAVFYGAYVYFEKLRIKNKEPKSQFREEMEDIWQWRGGLPREAACSYIVSAGFSVYEDDYGRVRSERW